MQKTLISISDNVFLKFPSNVAIRFSSKKDNISISYSSLNTHSKLVADNLNYFLNLNSSHNQFIGISLDVTYTFPSIIYGVLSLGCAFVPLDNLNGLSWNEDVINKLKIKYIITNNRKTDLVKERCVGTNFLILKEEVFIIITDVEEVNEPWKIPMAYSVQTSGSTGIPKIIRVPHQSIVPNILHLSELLEVTSDDEIYLSSPITFDPCMVELFLSLSNGATLHIVEQSLKVDPQALLDKLFPKDMPSVTILEMTPSLFRRWPLHSLQNRIFSGYSKLRVLLLGGERCPLLTELKNWKIKESTKVYDIYGVSEVSCWASIRLAWPVGQNVTIPLLETTLNIEDKDENNIGHMIIGSNSRVCFVDNEDYEILNNRTIFRSTGDLFQELDKEFKFVGRKDDMLKRWGVRFSLKEIEEFALRCTELSQAVCVTSTSSQSILVILFIVPSLNFDINQLYQYYSSQSIHLVPDNIIILQEIPVTSHGKTDKKILLEHVVEERSKMLPSVLFKVLWQQYSLSNNIQETKGFISSGGNSFSALQLIADIKQYLRISDDLLGSLVQDLSFNDCLLKVRYVERVQKKHIEKKFKIDNFSSFDDKIEINEMSSCSETNKSRSEISPKKIIEEVKDLIIELEENWKYDLGKCIDASPVSLTTQEGKVLIIVGSHSGRIAIIELKSGKCVSEITLPDRIESRAEINKKMKQFTVGCYDSYIYTYSFEGNLIWKFKTGDMVKCGPVLVKDTIICGSYDKFVYCLEPSNGDLIWKTLVYGQVLCQPLIVDEVVIVVTLSGRVMSLNRKTGKSVWSAVLYSPIFSSPVLLAHSLLICDVLGNLVTLNLHTGERIHEVKINGNVFSSLVSYDKSLLVCSDDHHVYKFDGNRISWKRCLDSRIISSPCVISLGPRQLICTVSSKGTLFLMDFISGNILTTYSFPHEVFSSPIYVSGSVIVGCRDNNLYSVQMKLVNL